MKSFQTFLTEGRKTFEELQHEIKGHLAKGEIVQPQYKDLKYHVSGHVEGAGNEIEKVHRWGKGDVRPTMGEHLADIRAPNSINEVGSLGKKLAKVPKQYHSQPYYQDLKAHHAKYSQMHQDMKALKGMVVKTAVKRAEIKQQAAKAQTAKHGDQSKLMKTLSQHHDEFVNKAKDLAGKAHDHYTTAIKKAGGLDAIAPEPHFRMSRDEYQRVKHHRTVHEYFHRTPKAAHVKQAGEAAHGDYEAWTHKLAAKIGKPVSHSEMHGNPWHHSDLHVTTGDGEKQHWHTKMIINQSKYGKQFNQFPSRRKA